MFVFFYHFLISWILADDEDLRLIRLAEMYVKNSNNVHTDHPSVGDFQSYTSDPEEFSVFVIKYKCLEDLRKHEFLKYIAKTHKERYFTRKTLSYPEDVTSVSLENLVYDLIDFDTQEDVALFSKSSKGVIKKSQGMTGKDLMSTVIQKNVFLEYYTFSSSNDKGLIPIINALKCVCESLVDENCRYTVIKFNNLNDYQYQKLHTNYELFFTETKKTNIPLKFEVYKFYSGHLINRKKTFGIYSDATRPADYNKEKIFGVYNAFQPKLKITKRAKKISKSDSYGKKEGCNQGDSVIYNIDIYLEGVVRYNISIKYTCNGSNPDFFAQYLVKITACVPGKQEKIFLDSASKYENKSNTQAVVIGDKLVCNADSFEKFLRSFELMLRKKLIYDVHNTNLDTFFDNDLSYFYCAYTEVHEEEPLIKRRKGNNCLATFL